MRGARSLYTNEKTSTPRRPTKTNTYNNTRSCGNRYVLYNNIQYRKLNGRYYNIIVSYLSMDDVNDICARKIYAEIFSVKGKPCSYTIVVRLNSTCSTYIYMWNSACARDHNANDYIIIIIIIIMERRRRRYDGNNYSGNRTKTR